MDTTTTKKQTLYTTAVSLVSAVGVTKGSFVSIRHYDFNGKNNTHYYMILDNGKDTGIVLPEHQLTRFCL